MRGLRLGSATAATLVAAATVAAGRASAPPPLAKRCGTAPMGATTTFRFEASDGVSLDGAVTGTGRGGIVLADQAYSSVCGAAPWAETLRESGFRVLFFDYRNTGLSTTVFDRRAGRLDADVVGAAKELRRRGSTRIALVGASIGGSVVLPAAVSLGRQVSAVVSMSGVATAQLDPLAAARRMTAPALIVGARSDSYAPASFTRKLFGAVAAKDKRLLVVPGTDHGFDIVGEHAARGPAVRRAVVEFLRTHTR